jgi:MIP family channel proteins
MRAEGFPTRLDGAGHRLWEGVPMSTATRASTVAPEAAATLTELIGTFILVFAITATASAAGLNHPIAGGAYESLAIVLVNGITLGALVAALGERSGGHFNPAVTIALAAVRRFPWRDVPGYIVAQLAGGVLAGLATWAVAGNAARTSMHLAANGPAPGVSDGRALLTEAFITLILVLVVAAVTDVGANPVLGPPAIGAALAAAVFIGGPVTGAAVNPARALGPMIASGHFTAWWVFIVGPIAGGLVAIGLYQFGVRLARPPAAAATPAASPPAAAAATGTGARPAPA